MERNRPDWCGYLHRAGALFQEWIVVQWAKVEQQKLCWIQSVPLFVNISEARNPTPRNVQSNETAQVHSVMTPHQLCPHLSATPEQSGRDRVPPFFSVSCAAAHFSQAAPKY
jgi:hypothetical protein